MPLLSTLSKVMRIFNDPAIPIERCLIKDAYRYSATIGDFRFSLDNPHDRSTGMVEIVISYRGVIIERKQDLAPERSICMKNFARKKFLARYDCLSSMISPSFDRLIAEFITRPELSDLSGIEISKKSTLDDVFRSYVIRQYAAASRTSYSSISKPFKFLPVSTGVMHPEMEVIDYNDELFLSTQFRLDQKHTYLYDNCQLQEIMERLNNLMLSLRSYSCMHIWGIKSDCIYQTHSNEFFFCNLKDSKLLLRIEIGSSIKDGLNIPTRLNILCIFDLVKKSVDLQVYKFEYSASSGYSQPTRCTIDIESRFKDRKPLSGRLLQYGSAMGTTAYGLVADDYESSNLGYDLDYEYYSDFLGALIQHYSLKYFPTKGTLDMCGCDEFNGELTDEQVKSLYARQ